MASVTEMNIIIIIILIIIFVKIVFYRVLPKWAVESVTVFPWILLFVFQKKVKKKLCTDTGWCFWSFEVWSFFPFFWFYRIRYIWIVCIIFEYNFQNQPNRRYGRWVFISNAIFLLLICQSETKKKKTEANRERNGWNEEQFKCVCEKT